MSVFGEALKKAGMATDQDIARTQREKVEERETRARIGVARVWVSTLTLKQVHLVATGEFDALPKLLRTHLTFHCEEHAYREAKKRLVKIDPERKRNAKVVAARKALQEKVMT